jgi:hypothetical protein
MPVSEIAEIFEGRSGSYTSTSMGAYRRRFRVITNYVGDDATVAMGACGVSLGDQYITINGSDPTAFATGFSAEQEDGDGFGWLVSVDYSWYSPNDVGGGPEQNPLLMPIDVSWEYRDNEYVVLADINNKPLLNSAGDPYDPPFTINLPTQIMTVVRNEATYDAGLAYVYRNSINSDSFAFQSALFAKCIAITPKNVFHPTIGWYYQVTYQFEFMNPRMSADGQGWRKSLLDIGLRQIDPKTGKPVPITLNGQPVTQGMLLDGTGKPLALNAAPIYNMFQVYNELPFSEFNFDVAAITGNRTGFPEN